MRKFFKNLARSWAVIIFLYILIRLYTLTFRLKVENEETWKKIVEEGGVVLLVAWHQHFFAAIRHFRNYREYKPGLMISRSKDGDIIAGVAARTGWRPARGSSSKGGKEALVEMIEKLQETRLAGHVVDGPRGPAGRVKAGTIRIAHGGGAKIVPFYVTATRAWYMRSWDRFFIPKPFSTVSLRFGEPISFEVTKDKDLFEKQRLELEQIMRKEADYNEEWPG